MYRRVAHRLTLQTTIAFTVFIALLPLPGVSLLISGVAQGRFEERRGQPKPGKPEGDWPNLDQVKDEAYLENEAPPPIPSTLRSRKNDGKPWDGRRVGDPDDNTPQRGNAGSTVASDAKPTTARRSGQTRRAHARVRMALPPPPHDQFVQNFFTWALTRSPNSEETTYWYDQLRKAYPNGATSLKLAGIELGRTLFESAEYAARNRDAHWYVYDLFKTYLMRDPDAGGWAMWEGLVPTHGREYVRRGFEESGEFATLSANITTSGSPSSTAASLISARVDPRNQPGTGMLSRDTNWSLPLLSLPGRNELDLGLALAYSSMVWTRSGPYIYFDEDNGFPSPGFRLGFPTLQRKVFDTQTAKNAYLLITAAGRRVELRQVNTSNLYDAADSSYLRLTEDGALLLVHSTDGTRMTYSEANGEYRCIEIKDRNGNYIIINYNSLGRITNITDTLGRVITFNYDTNANLSSITQLWNGQTHTWATFGWTTHTIQSSFGSLKVVGTANNAQLPLLQQVGLLGGDRYTFEYTNPAQVSVVRRYRADNTQPFYTVYQYESTTTDTPRLNQTRVAAENWTSLNGVPGEVATNFAVDPDGACRMTAPDGTIYKEYYGTSWQKGLKTLSEVWSGSVRQKWTTTAWTQDNTAVSYEVNPRITETNVYDQSGNRRRTTIDYGPYAQWGLPYSLKEYATDAVTPIRETLTDYNLSQAYLDRRIIGLVSAIHMTNITSWQRKIDFTYDDPARLHALPASATQHDTTYNTSFTARGNVTAVSQWDVNDIVNSTKALTTYTNYFITGTPKSTTDPSGHPMSIAYGDSFSDNVNRNTFAYPTTVTDADNFSSTVQYNFNFGARTRTQGPPPANQSQGAIQTITYDSIGRLERTTTANNGAYTRYVYGPNFVQTFSTINNVADEAYAIEVVDGVGRVIGTGANHPGSAGGFRGQMTIYDLMGRPMKTANPAEMTGEWTPTGEDAAGWLYTQQTYDWQGRPGITTNPDLTTKQASYTGCGCAGGSVMTITDEGTIEAGVAKRRQQKIYSDVFGRTLKTEILNWQGGTVYSTTVNTYNARDQLTQVREYAGPEGSTTYQDTSMTYDGYGRLKTKHVPEQNGGTATTWVYNADDTVQSITDARGATSTFTYNNARHLPNIVTHTLSGSSTLVETFGYDAAGNRTSMADNSGGTSYQYNQLSQLTSETRTFTGLAGNYTLTYDYNPAGQLKSLTDHTNQKVTYVYDTAGRLNTLTGTNYSFNQFITGILYRAWGAAKQISYGNGRTATMTYNSRLRATHYEVPAAGGFSAGLSVDYQYFDDGRLKFSHDVLDNKLDRSYEYNHAARLTKALSGAEARGGPATTNRPYKETATYDEFGHLTNRSNLHWSRPLGFGSADTYVNNRRVGWTYDANGNWLSGGGRQHTYDAAGRNTTTTWTYGGSSSQSYDGDDRRVKSVDQGDVTFYLRSTILNGQVIEELNNTGAKQSGFIYAGEKLIGHQLGTGIVAVLYEDPSGVSIRSSSASSAIASYWLELDPWGAEVYKWDPYVGDPGFPGGRGEGGPIFPGVGDISMPSTGCSQLLDGVLTLCDFASRNLNGNGILVERMREDGTLEYLPITFNLGVARVVTLRPPRAWPYDAPLAYAEFPGGAEWLLQKYGVLEIIEVDLNLQKTTKIDPVIVKQAISDCISGLYNMFSMVSFKPTQAGVDGVIRIRDVHTGTEANIVSDSTPPADVSFDIVEHGARGRTDSWNPWWTYAIGSINAPALKPGEIRYPTLYLAPGMDWVRTQIHETGAALTILRNKYHPGPAATKLPDGGLDPDHEDDGPAMEDCVGRKVYERLGLKPNN